MAKRIMKWTGATNGDVNTATNYSVAGAPAAAVPITGDDLYVELGSVSMDASLNALAAVVLDNLIISKSFTGQIGTAAAFLEIQSLNTRIGEYNGSGSPSGSNRIKLKLTQADAAACVVEVFDGASSSADTNLPPIQLNIQHTDSGASPDATAILRVRKGKVGLAVNDPSDDSEVLTIETSFVTQKDADAVVEIGDNVTLTNLTLYGGQVKTKSAATTVKAYAGTLQTEGAVAFTTVTVSDAMLVSNATGTIGELNVEGSGEADFTKSSAARTVTTLNRRGSGKVRYDGDVLTITTLNTNGTVLLSES